MEETLDHQDIAVFQSVTSPAMNFSAVTVQLLLV